MRLGVDEKDSVGIFRVDDGKANLAPPAAQALYRRMIGYKMPNGEYVGVAVPFKMPDMFDGITAKEALKVQHVVGRALEDDAPYKMNAQARNWVGYAVANVLELDMDKAPEKARVKAIVKKWMETNVLCQVEWKDKRQGRETNVVAVGEWITREQAGL